MFTQYFKFAVLAPIVFGTFGVSPGTCEPRPAPSTQAGLKRELDRMERKAERADRVLEDSLRRRRTYFLGGPLAATFGATGGGALYALLRRYDLSRPLISSMSAGALIAATTYLAFSAWEFLARQAHDQAIDQLRDEYDDVVRRLESGPPEAPSRAAPAHRESRSGEADRAAAGIDDEDLARTPAP